MIEVTSRRVSGGTLTTYFSSAIVVSAQVKDVARGRRAAVGPLDHDRVHLAGRRVGIARHPGDEDDVARLHVGHLRADFDHLAGRLVAQDLVAVARIVHLVQLRVADTGRELSDDDLKIAGIRQVDALDGQRFVRLGKKNYARGSRHRWFLT